MYYTKKVASIKFGEIEFFVDYHNKNIVDKHIWNISYIVNKHSKFQKPYICTSIQGKTIYLHRILMGCPKYKTVDHINGNTLDNREENLRICTHQENHFNRAANSNGSSKYKGVCWNKASRKWQAQIKKDKVNHTIGQYAKEEDAAKAYNEKARAFFGKYAYLNEL